MIKRKFLVAFLLAWVTFLAGIRTGGLQQLPAHHMMKTHHSHQDVFFTILLNNCGVLVILILVSILSVGTLGLIVMYINGEVLGQMIHIAFTVKGLSTWIIMGTVIPQGIFEISAYAIGWVSASFVSLIIAKRLFGFTRKTSRFPFLDYRTLAKQMSVSLMLLIMAAGIESVIFYKFFHVL